MTSADRLQARVRAVRARAAIRRWELRQHHHAGGVWDRLQRRLALARRAWAISEPDAAALTRRGYTPDPAGLALEPIRRWFVVPEAEILELTEAQEVSLQFSSSLLAFPRLAVVPFDRATLPNG